MAWRLALVLFVSASCVRSLSEDCGGHLVCASGQACLHASDGTNDIDLCIDRGQFADCRGAGRSEGDECDGGLGRCYSGACLPISCGDHLVDPGTALRPPEQCDDGNTTPGDHCSADCRSNETCGNGVVDPIASEICDDGNLRSHDGCTDRCRPETPRWTQLQPATPDPAGAAAIAYVPATGRVVRYGGLAGANPDTFTWEWNGAGWFARTPQFHPPPRFEHAMAYDPDHKVVVVFGGSGGGPTIQDTWTWNGEAWKLAAVSGPSRAQHAMAYDVRRHHLVMFGGVVSNGALFMYQQDTWEWDGTTWTLRDTGGPSGPAARSGHAMAYDATHGVVVMFGGRDSTGKVFGDTWTWDGTSWTVRSTMGPEPREGAILAADPRGLILYGGTDGVTTFADTWRWDGTTWTDLARGDPGPRAKASATTDLARHRIVMVGGQVGDKQVWEWDGTAWTGVAPEFPTAGADTATGFDPLRGRALVVAGGLTSSVRDGSWTTLAPAPAPARSGASAAYDIVRDHLVMFGGNDSIGSRNDTWWFDGATQVWRLAATSPTPGRREHAAMTYDAARSRIVLFGGEALGTFGDTWELDDTWHPMTPTTSPSPRASAAIGYDPLHRRTVLFGGTDGAVQFDDTWEWDGTTWTRQVVIGPSPLARSGAALVWNPVRERLTLIAGDAGVYGKLDDAWEWDGATWQEVAVQGTPGGRSRHFAVPSSDGTGVFIYGGEAKSGVIGDSWLLRWAAEGAQDDLCRDRRDLDGDGFAGCADPDCWAECSPLCPPGVSCVASAPRCGDGALAPQDSCELCPQDGVACPMCGDQFCEPPETTATCPGDCP